MGSVQSVIYAAGPPQNDNPQNILYLDPLAPCAYYYADTHPKYDKQD